MAVLAWWASIAGAVLVRAGLHKAAKWFWGKSLDEFELAVDNAVETAYQVFRDRYGDKYGTVNFIDREANQTKLLRSTFPTGRRLTVSDLDPRGFDGATEAPPEVVGFFLEAFYRALDGTESRALDRDRSIQDAARERADIRKEVEEGSSYLGAQIGGVDQKLDAFIQEKTLPDPIRAAVLQPNLDELGELLKAGRARDALNYAVRQTENIDAALAEVDDQERRYPEALRTYRQRLLFAAASAASWLGEIEEGRTWWRRACELGPGVHAT